ncbi:hypothetical protein KOW79_020420 [Hemibagrus wyckioides]|uniref:EGF-like domain-containing protein n=1 Tax=Hemibagrus wyckioides TaxID=337641 RepID=A0A9D3N6C0_9TELE|nr:mucin-2 [Hemibagrus wyckioides]KAG7315554.1 hypothetical protein KOW79_020420 [Hemibagrus wyckioides]
MRLFHFSLVFTFITGLNTSEEDPDPSQIPYLDSSSDLASPSRDGSTGVTHLLDVFGVRNAHTLQTVSVRQGGGHSGLGDKTRFHFVPQESTHNGQDKAGSVISDLAHTATHSLTDSRLSFTEKEQDSSAETQWPGLSGHTLTTATSTDSNTGANTLPHTTAVHSDIRHDTDTPLLLPDVLTALDSKIFHSNDITVMSSAPVVSQSHSTTHGNRATATELEMSESHGFRNVPDGRDTSVMSSSFPANEGQTAAQRSSETFWTNSLPQTNHRNPNYPGLSVTDVFLNDSVSDPELSESNSVTYLSDGAVRSSVYTDTGETGVGRTNRIPRSTHINKNLSGHTASSLFDDVSTMTDTPPASLSSRQMDTATLPDDSGNVSTVNRKRMEYYSHTPYYTSSPNTQTQSAPAQASHTVHTQYATVQTTDQQMSDWHTHTHTSLPTHSDSRSSSVTPTGRDFISTSASPSPNTLSQGDPSNPSTVQTSCCTKTQQNNLTTTLGPITVPYETTDTNSIPVSELQTRTDNDSTNVITEMNTLTSDLNTLPHVTALSTDSRPMTVTHHAPSTSRNDPVTVTTPSPAVTPPPCLSTPSPAVRPPSHLTTPSPAVTPPSRLTTPSPAVTPPSRLTTPSPAVTPPSRLTTPSPAVTPPSRLTTPSPVVTPPSRLTTPSPAVRPPSRLTTPSPAVTPPSRLTPPTPAVIPSRLTSPLTHTFDTVTTNRPSTNLHTTQTTTRQAETRIPNHLATSKIIQQPDTTTTTTQQVHTNTQAGTHTPLSPLTNQTSWHRTFTRKTDKDRSHKGRVFIMDDQPAIIKLETFQVLLQVILEENSPPYAGLVEVEPFLQNVAGYQSQHVTWHSGPVLQSVVIFRTAEAVSWLERAESLLEEVGLKPLPAGGVFVSGVRVKNITVGGLHSDLCSWLFSCPSHFSCVSSEGNVTCRSVCHSEYCKNHGICVHRSGQNPVCQCPVGEDFWFMGQRCDLRMTRQRLAGVCSGVLAAIAVLMGLLAYLAVQRFKKMLIQAKAEQTQSSYRRFNHFDELSARFWRRSWPGSRDSLDNTAFTRSDELLHMRAMDRACCYHDDTLSLASTYQDSVAHLNTVYPHSSQYNWDMSTCSLADGVVDSGKASDLSVCSWPIEPIQWTPFPLLQQLRNTNTVKPSRPRSYCEGMELVGLEKSRTA